MITIIAAIAKNNALGKDNDLIWHLPEDLKRFKKLTSGHHILMGRNTFESIGKPLPNRTSVNVPRGYTGVPRAVARVFYQRHARPRRHGHTRQPSGCNGRDISVWGLSIPFWGHCSRLWRVPVTR